MATHLKVEYSGFPSPSLILPYLLKDTPTSSRMPKNANIRVREPNMSVRVPKMPFATFWDASGAT